MSDEKIGNAIGILNYFYEQHSIREIEKIVWGYRAKPKVYFWSRRWMTLYFISQNKNLKY